jgi:hypothetical protein
MLRILQNKISIGNIKKTMMNPAKLNKNFVNSKISIVFKHNLLVNIVILKWILIDSMTILIGSNPKT